MTARSRSESSTDGGYRVYKPTGTITWNYRTQYLSTCEDVIDEGDNQSFRVESYWKDGGMLNGEQSSPTGHIWVDYPATYFDTDPYAREHLSITDNPSLGEAATQLLRRTNPSRSSLQGIVALAELREIPGLIKTSYDTALGRLYKYIPRRLFRNLSRAAKLNLMVQFGIIPLISDLAKTLEFQKLVDQRVKEIERLRTRGLRRTVEIWRGSKITTVPNQIVHSSLVTYTANIHKVMSLIIRGHIRWYVDDNWSVLSDNDHNIGGLAARIIAGTDLDPSAVYEALPWSWLVDYFTNLGSYVSAKDNQLDARHDTPRIMRHAVTIVTSSKHSTTAGMKLSPYLCRVDWKTRYVTSATLGARIDFLEERQWSILASLSVLKLRLF
jgi:hypothetical protein